MNAGNEQSNYFANRLAELAKQLGAQKMKQKKPKKPK